VRAIILLSWITVMITFGFVELGAFVNVANDWHARTVKAAKGIDK
jgi:hypothetical protein